MHEAGCQELSFKLAGTTTSQPSANFPTKHTWKSSHALLLCMLCHSMTLCGLKKDNKAQSAVLKFLTHSPSPIDKLHGFNCQGGGDHIICIVPAATNCHQAIQFSYHKHQIVLKRRNNQKQSRKTSSLLAIHAWLKPTILSRSIGGQCTDIKCCQIQGHQFRVGNQDKVGPWGLVHTYRTHKAKQSCSCEGLVWYRNASCCHWDGLEEHRRIQTLTGLIRTFTPLLPEYMKWGTTARKNMGRKIEMPSGNYT